MDRKSPWRKLTPEIDDSPVIETGSSTAEQTREVTVQSQAKLEEYRRMTPAERLRITFELIEEGWKYLDFGTPEQVQRKYQRIREENDLFNRRVLDALARTKKAGQ